MYSADFLWPSVLAARVPPLVSAMRCRAIRCRLTPLTSTFLTSWDRVRGGGRGQAEHQRRAGGQGHRREESFSEE